MVGELGDWDKHIYSVCVCVCVHPCMYVLSHVSLFDMDHSPPGFSGQTTWSASWEIYIQVRKQQLELDVEQQTSSK